LTWKDGTQVVFWVKNGWSWSLRSEPTFCTHLLLPPLPATATPPYHYTHVHPTRRTHTTHPHYLPVPRTVCHACARTLRLHTTLHHLHHHTPTRTRLPGFTSPWRVAPVGLNVPELGRTDSYRTRLPHLNLLHTHTTAIRTHTLPPHSRDRLGLCRCAHSHIHTHHARYHLHHYAHLHCCLLHHTLTHSRYIHRRASPFVRVVVARHLAFTRLPRARRSRSLSRILLPRTHRFAAAAPPATHSAPRH